MRIAVVALLSIGWLGDCAETGRAPGPGFSYKAPPGCVAQPPDASKSEYVFLRQIPGQRPSVILRMQVLDRLLAQSARVDREVIEQADRDGYAAAGLHTVRFEYRTMRWRTFDLPLMVSYASEGTTSLVTLAVHLPLSPRSIQIIATSRPEQEGRLKEDLDALVASIAGPTNWVTDASS